MRRCSRVAGRCFDHYQKRRAALLMADPVHIARARLARACRTGDPEAERIARVELTEAHLQRHVAVILQREHKPRLEAVEQVCAALRAGISA
jgi:hypothetical protein